MELPTNLDELSIEQLTKLALDRRESTALKILERSDLHTRVSDHRKALVQDTAARALLEGIDVLRNQLRASEDLGKTTNATKLLHTIAGYDAQETKQNDKAVLIIELSNGSYELKAGHDPIEGTAVKVPDQPMIIDIDPELPPEPKPLMTEADIDNAFKDLLD
jgi:hypothetical protein